MKVYIAGPLCNKPERDFAEKIEKISSDIGFETFLPHRDIGLWKEGTEFSKIAKGDLKGFENCKLVVAILNGFNVGAGTAWEMGYAHAKNIPVIGIKTDRKVNESIEELSAIIIGTTKILESTENLKKELKNFIIQNN